MCVELLKVLKVLRRFYRKLLYDHRNGNIIIPGSTYTGILIQKKLKGGKMGTAIDVE